MTSSNSRDTATDLGLLAIRAMLATVFVYHGGQKLFGLFGGHGLDGFAGYLASLGVPLPALSALLAGSAEFFGGLILLAGVAFRWALIPLVITMLVAALTAHTGFNIAAGGNEYALTLAVVVAALALIGPGRYSLPHLVRDQPGERARA